jgi:hypothetical protein
VTKLTVAFLSLFVASNLRAQVTFARAKRDISGEELRMVGGWETYSRNATEWRVEKGEIYIFQKYADRAWINHPANEFSVLRIDNVTITLATKDIDLIDASSPVYSTAEKLYVAEIKQKGSEEAKMAELARQYKAEQREAQRDALQREMLRELERIRLHQEGF